MNAAMSRAGAELRPLGTQKSKAAAPFARKGERCGQAGKRAAGVNPAIHAGRRCAKARATPPNLKKCKLQDVPKSTQIYKNHTIKQKNSYLLASTPQHVLCNCLFNLSNSFNKGGRLLHLVRLISLSKEAIRSSNETT